MISWTLLAMQTTQSFWMISRKEWSERDREIRNAWETIHTTTTKKRFQWQSDFKKCLIRKQFFFSLIWRAKERDRGRKHDDDCLSARLWINFLFDLRVFFFFFSFSFCPFQFDLCGMFESQVLPFSIGCLINVFWFLAHQVHSLIINSTI